MKRTPLCSGAAALIAGGAVFAHPPYRLTDVGDFAGGEASAGAFGITNRGEALGGADGESGRQAFVHRNGQLVRLPVPDAPHAVYSEAYFGTRGGMIAGNTYDLSLRSRAAIWDADGYHDLGVMGAAESGVIGMNESGAIVGYRIGGVGGTGFIWLPKAAYGFPAGASTISEWLPRSINDSGQVAAQARHTDGMFHGAIWLPEPAHGLEEGINVLATPMFPLGTLPYGMNNRGEIVGAGRTPDGDHPALWLPVGSYGFGPGWHDLGREERDRSSFVWDINNRGWAVGTRVWIGDPPNEFEDPPIFIEGWVWIPGQGKRDLTELIPAEKGYAIVYPRAINDRGEIAASAVSFQLGGYRGVMLSLVCPADWDADGVLNSGDFFAFLTGFLAEEADFNADGVTSSQDFFDYLVGFFGGCPS